MDKPKEPPVPKSRKLLFDPLSFRFYFESSSQSVARVSFRRAKQVRNANRCEQKKLEMNLKRIEGYQDIFEHKLSSEVDDHRARMKDMVAHSRALQGIANHSQPLGHLGKYGLNATKEQLHQKIELEKKKLTASHMRRERSEMLLKTRAPMTQIDRKVDTSTLFTAWRKARSSTISLEKPGRVLLPPIKVQITDCSSAHKEQIFITQMKEL
ncbi:hypothetical protein CAPTEDRAFT_227488 [Capitella teleta]|uniref:Uncharacterized protein n=1 Tax=Capitella teleta TaxID=283909 RepID=R7V5J0_CAPTE|nr:hypothetical protein CAPTEDRAFT_227488 [Capitella teleta]|eukprot:ELU11616.1 hypothetical protein CAPTEDRAFT_227488 [Capitella teleta]